MISPKCGIVCIDVDGTIIDQNDNLRPYVIQFVHALQKDEITVYLWSGNGADYTWKVARRWFIEDFFDGFLDKSGTILTYLESGTTIIDNEDLVTTGKLIKVVTYDRELYPDDDVFRELLLQHIHTEG